MANENQNIRNIIWNAQGWKPGILVGTGEEISPDWILIVDTQVTDIPFGLAFKENFKNEEPRIGYMATLISLRIQSITPNARMTQTKIKPCGATHYS